MRILFVCPTLPDSPEKDGMTLIAFFLLRELSKRHAVTVWAAGEPSDSVQATVQLGVRQARVFPILHRPLWSYFLVGSRFPWYQTRRDSPALHIALHTMTAKQFDLVVLHSPFMAHYVHDVTDTPVVIQAVDAMSTWFLNSSLTEPFFFRRWHLRNESRRAAISESRDYRLAKAVTFVSPDDAQTISARLPREQQVEFIPNGIDPNIFYPPQTPRQDNTLVFTGVMDYPPNSEADVWFATQVWPGLKQRHPELQLRLVGKNPTPDVMRLGHTPGITVTGRVPSVAEELRRATIAVSPLQHGTGFKNKVLEALACGTPLVASPISIPGTGVTANTQALLATTPEEWISAIERLLSDDALRQQLSTGGLALAAQYHWPAVAKRVEELYDSCTHG